MISSKYQNLLKRFADANQGATQGQNAPAPQQDPNQQQQMQNQGQQQVDPNQQQQMQGQQPPMDPNQMQQPQQPDPNQQMQAEAQKDQITNDVMSKVASGTVYLMARNMAIKKGFQPGTPEYYRYIGEAIEVGSGCAN